MIVTLQKTNIIHLPTGETLMPGANEVSKESVQALIENPVLKILVDEGSISFNETDLEKEDSEVLSSAHLATLKQPEAIELVKLTASESMLKSWAAEEKRAQVLKAIEKQIAALAEETQLRSGSTEPTEK